MVWFYRRAEHAERATLTKDCMSCTDGTASNIEMFKIMLDRIW